MTTDTLPLFSLDPTTADKFDDFHRNNPHVYSLLVGLSREWIATTGIAKLGMKMLFERARWNLAIATKSADFKLNNDFTPFYARLIMDQERDLAGIFSLRRSAADDVIGRAW